MTLSVDVGDVLVVSVGPRWVRTAINLGDFLRHGHWENVNHVVMVHHRHPSGRWQGIEGRPGGVGLTDVTGYLNSKSTVSNAAQPKTDEQRYLLAKAAERLMGAPYDWLAIGADALMSLELVGRHLGPFLAPDWHDDGIPPTHVVCSSYHDWAYETDAVGLASPNGFRGTRWTTPADWKRFCLGTGWA